MKTIYVVVDVQADDNMFAVHSSHATQELAEAEIEKQSADEDNRYSEFTWHETSFEE